MKIVADKDIPFLKGVLEPYSEVLYIKGAEIEPESVNDADALLIRTRTRCNDSLLHHSKVSFIGSATIGTDHVDLEYLKQKGISFVNAPGCNAGGVMQYVHTALFDVACEKGISLKNKTLGVVGAGNTGGRVAFLAEYLGFNVLRNDPPKEALGGDVHHYCPLDYLLKNADIVSMHLPLDESTFEMASESFFSKMKKGAFFINASRGEVVCDEALLNHRNSLSALILDVWRGEPENVSRFLVDACDIATPHIAGYSYEGKINGTTMIVRSLARHFGFSNLIEFDPPHTPTPEITFYKNNRLLPQKDISKEMNDIFTIREMDSLFRRNISNFEKIRSEYNYRREFRWK